MAIKKTWSVPYFVQPYNKQVVLTFDDGHISNFQLAYPILKKFGFAAIFFIVSEFIGKDNYLNVKQIREMHQNNMQFGSHSRTHPFLIAQNKQKMNQEINQSRIDLQNLTQQEINHFCIPHGFYNKDILVCAEQAGYRSVVTEDFGYCKPDNKPFKVFPRFTVKAGITQQRFIDIVKCRRFRLLPQYGVEKTLNTAKKVLEYRNYICFKSMLLRYARPKRLK